MTEKSPRRLVPPPIFRSRLKPLSILELERMSPAQLQPRERDLKDWLAEEQRSQQPKPKAAPR
jgi:hypothetical protein